MEFWTEVRRRVLTEGLSKRSACVEYGIGWRTLQKILRNVEPLEHGLRNRRKKRKIDSFAPIIEEILKTDKQAPKKQRHTAWRIFERLRDEYQFSGGYTIVKDAVRELKQANKEAFVPLSHPPGEAQVDYGFAQVILRGEPTKVAFFVMTLPYSDAIFCQVFPRECTESFQEGHKRAFDFFGGVARRISYDNSKIAVAKIIGNRERKVTREFLRLQSHHLFESHFCLVRRPNEKGHVERLLEFARKRFLVPVPKVDSLEDLNALLRQRCSQDLSRRLRGQTDVKSVLLEHDRAAFLPMPAQPFEARRIAQASASSLSLVRFDCNSYSVPTKYAYRRITVIGGVEEVRLVYEDRLVARHRRCWGKEKFVFNPVHYLALLERKPGGFDHAKPLEDWNLPECFDVLRRRLEAAHDSGIIEFIKVLRLLELFSLRQLTDAVEYALDLDCLDAEAIRFIVDYRAESSAELFSLDGHPQLRAVTVETTDPASYQCLMSEVAS